MKSVAYALAIGVAAIASGPAQAADWWLLSGVPSDPTAIFADASTLARHHHSAEMLVLRIDRFGETTQTLQQIRCDSRSASHEEQVVEQFACAPDRKRDEHGLILESIDPLLMARMIFNSDGQDQMALGLEPRT